MTNWAWWERDFLPRERTLCVVLTAALVVLSEGVLRPGRLDDYLAEARFTVFPAIAALLGALLGLVIAAAAVVLDQVAEGRLELVQRSARAPALWATFKSAMWALGLSTLLALVILIPTASAIADRILVYAWLFSALLVTARLARMIWIIGRLMDIAGAQSIEDR
jgi:hypothetical protein